MNVESKERNNLWRTCIKSSKIMRYFFISCLATVLDVALVWLFYRVLKIPVVPSNTIGVVCGFLISYLLTARFVFPTAAKKGGFSIFFVTFLFGLLLADLLIYMGEHFLFVSYGVNVSFFLSKGLSVAIPFFVLYFVRKQIYAHREKSMIKKDI